MEAGIPGGRQDQFSAAFGGFLRLGFRDPEASVEPLALDPSVLGELERRMLLVYTGASHFSGATIGRVMHAYERGDRAVTAALHGSAGSRRADARGAPRRATSPRIGALLDRNWAHQQTLDPAMCTPLMARLGEAMRDAGALGGKAAGSGAGGCMFFLGPDDPEPAAAAARAMGMTVLPVRWSARGLHAC